MKQLLFIGVLAVLLLSSCKGLEEPTILRIEDVNVNELSKDRIDLDANMIIYNPNGVALDLSSADLKMIIDDIEIAHMTQNYDLTMPANSEFKMPAKIVMDLKKLYGDNPLNALGKGLQIISTRELDVLFKGNIKAGKGMMKITVPVDQIENVKF